MKYLDFYAKVFNRYKIIIYAFVATLILLQHVLIAYTFYAFSAFELSLVLIDFYRDSRKLKYENQANDIQIIKLKLQEKKVEEKQEKKQSYRKAK